MKRKLTMMLLCMMVAVTALAQSAISGTVVSAQDGEPIIGAAVKVKGAKQGVVTNLEGQSPSMHRQVPLSYSLM